jgi:hypothetical protein
MRNQLSDFSLQTRVNFEIMISKSDFLKRKMLKALLVLVATAGMIVFNWMAASGQIGKAPTGTISDKYPTKLTPADYAFSIWGLIYLGLIAFSIYQLLPSKASKFDKIRLLYIFSCMFNVLWLYTWGWENITVSFVVIIFLLISLALANIELTQTENSLDYWLVKFPFAIYFGWVTVATVVNATVALKSIGIEPTPLSDSTVASILIFVTAALAVFVCWKLRNYFYPLPIAWAVTAIAIKQSGSETAIVVFSALAVIVCLLASMSFVLRESSP